MTLRDDLGRAVTFPFPVRRIVSLAPTATENLFAIGAGALVVGATTADDYPPAAKRLPRIGNFYQPSVERIRALRPDLVIVESATANRAAMDNLQARLKRPVFTQKSLRYADVPRHLEQLGRITGKTAGAARAAAGMNAKAAQVARRIAGKRPVTVFIQIEESPLYAVGPGSFMDDLIRRAGGTNIVRGDNPFPIYSREALLAADPNFYIITVPVVPSGPPVLPPPLNRLSAARNRRVYYLNAALCLALPRAARTAWSPWRACCIRPPPGRDAGPGTGADLGSGGWLSVLSARKSARYLSAATISRS